MVVVVFRSRIRPEFATEFREVADRMFAICRTMPGFLSYKVYQHADGQRVSIHEWESAEHLRAWREHPEHVAVQQLDTQLGREQTAYATVADYCEKLHRA